MVKNPLTIVFDVVLSHNTRLDHDGKDTKQEAAAESRCGFEEGDPSPPSACSYGWRFPGTSSQQQGLPPWLARHAWRPRPQRSTEDEIAEASINASKYAMDPFVDGFDRIM